MATANVNRVNIFIPLLASVSFAADFGRAYMPGEAFTYRIEGRQTADGVEVSRYGESARAFVGRLPDDGPFFEQLRWRDGFLQQVSLDPQFKNVVPDLSRAPQGLTGPILDTLTFFVDARLTSKSGRIPHGKPNSWADGRRVLVGSDRLDFEVTPLGAKDGVAAFQVDHVPPDGGDNWFQLVGQDGRFVDQRGIETFRVLLRIRRSDGALLSATMSNPVEYSERSCADRELKDCGAASRHSLLREIAFRREEAGSR